MRRRGYRHILLGLAAKSMFLRFRYACTNMYTCVSVLVTRFFRYALANGATPSFLILLTFLFSAMPAFAAISVSTTRISHGVEAWYVANDSVPVVDIVLNFEGAGTVSDPESKAGRAAFAAAMLTEGAGTLDSTSFGRALEEQAISLEANASEDRLTIHIHCLRGNAARAGELLALALSQPQLAEADMARIRAQMTSMLVRMEENPNYQSGRLLQQKAFAGHPYANPPLGTKTSIGNLGAQDVRDYLKTYVTRGNVLITAAGDVNSGLLNDVLKNVVDALADNDAGAVATTQATLQGAGEVLHQTMPVPQTVVTFAAPSLPRDDKHFYAVYLLNHILGGSDLFSRLSDGLRQQKGLVYGISTELDMRRGAALLAGSLATRNATADAAVAEVKAVLEQVRSKGVTAQECNDAKTYVLGSFPLQLDRSRNVASILQMMRIHHLGEDYLTERAKLFSNVTCADINAVADQLLNPSRFLFAVVGGTPDMASPAPTPAPASGADAR